MPFFSVIIPTLNVEATLGVALASVLVQTETDLEIVIQDGGSTDATRREISADPRVRFEAEPDEGIYDALNKGIARCGGEWIYVLGADDRLHDAAVLADVRAFLEAKPNLRAVYGDVVSPRWEQRYNGPFDAAKLYDCNICHQALFVHRSVFDALGLFDLRFPVLADWHHNMRWFFDPRFPSGWMDRVIARYGDDGLSSSCSGDGFLELKAEMYLRFGGRALPKRRLRRCLRDLGRHDLRSGHPIRGSLRLAESFVRRFF